MFFKIDVANGLPIYEQIGRQVKFAVASEALKVGEMVPSVREMARELAINPNTVARAYRELQTDGVLESVRGSGLAISNGATKRCVKERVELVRDRLRQVLREARMSQLDLEAIRHMVDEELARLENGS